VLRELGAEVRSIGFREPPMSLLEDDDHELGVKPVALVFDPGDELEAAQRVLDGARQEPRLRAVRALVVLQRGRVARLPPWSGFDDFIVQPFGSEELYARIRALRLRRAEIEGERWVLGKLVVDTGEHVVAIDGSEVEVTAKELGLLAYFCEHPGKVLSRTHLLERVWKERTPGRTRTVDVHVRRLRKKLGSALPLETLRGLGYRLRAS
jgi:hypothetical protein